MFLLALLFAAILCAQPDRPDNQPFPAHKIVGNVYYVGASDITVYLIATPAGHVLVNAGYEETVPLIRASMEKLGFKMSDVRYLVNGQAHYDHVTGLATLRKLTGAQILASEGDAGVIEGGGKGDFHFDGLYSWPPVKVDRRLRDRDEIKIGGTTLVAHVTGGHSRGCTTWTLTTEEGGRRYNVVIVGGTTINPGVVLAKNPKYPEIADDYGRTFRRLRALACDVFLGAHGVYYGMKEKHARLAAGEQPNPYIDPAGYRTHVNRMEKLYLDQLARERAGK